MQFLVLYRPGREGVQPPAPEKMGRLVEEQTRAGVLVLQGGFDDGANPTHVRVSGGKFSVTDGPFTETKEMITGFALLNVSSRKEAIEQASRFLELMGEGDCELHELFEAGDGAGR
jgi:hypothetical protein